MATLHRGLTSTSRAPRAREAGRPAFALVIAISLMAFILMLLLSLTAVVKMEMQASGNAMKQAQAREHARLGLLTALGELQKQAGHDQRVTGTAGTMGYYTSPLPANWTGSTDVSGFEVAREKGNYVGVWDADGNMQGNWLVSDNPAITSIDLNDLSSDGDIALSAVGSLLNRDEQALLVGPGSIDVAVDEATRYDVANGSTAGNGKPDDAVVVEKVPISVQDGSVQEIGNYAYWVGDEGAKIKLNVDDRAADASAAHSAYSAAMLRLATAQKHGASLIDGSLDTSVDLTGFPDGDALVNNRLLGLRSIELYNSSFDTEQKRLFHDVTLHSYGLLTDTKHGSLKKDLSYALDPANTAQNQPETMVNSLGATDATLLFDPQGPVGSSPPVSNANPGGPKWAQLKDWYQLRPVGNELKIRSQDDEQHGIYPIIASVRMWLYAGLVRQDPDPMIPGDPYRYRVRYFFFPSIVLANPYGYDIDIDDPLFFRYEYINAPTLRAQVFSHDGIVGPEVTIDFPLYDRRLNSSLVASRNGADPWNGVQAYVFSIQPSTIGAGETMVYTPPFGNQPMAWMNEQGQILNDNGTVSSSPALSVPVNTLEPGYRTPGSGFYFDATDVALTTSTRYELTSVNKCEVELYRTIETAGVTYLLATERDFNSQSILTICHRNQNYGLWTETAGWAQYWPKVRVQAQVIEPGDDALDLDSANGGPMPAYAYITSLRMTNNSVVSPNTIDENIDLPMRWIGQYNPRAAFAGRSPDEWDWAENKPSWTDHKGVSHPFPPGGRTNYRDSYYTCPNWITKWFNETTSSSWQNLPVIGNRMRWGYSDTIADGKDEVVLFEVPSDDYPIASLGQLQHVNFSRNLDYDSFKRVDLPGGDDEGFWFLEVDRDPGAYTFNNIQPAYAVGNSWASPYIPSENTHIDWTNKYDDGSPGMGGSDRAGTHYDYSWLINDVLWDRYFFSTMSQAGTGPAGSAATFPMPNGRLVPYAGEDGQAPTNAQLQDFYTPSSHLLVDGAFNVHSASPAAWKALLASLVGADASDPSASPFMRVHNTSGDAFDASGSGAADDDEAYYGYRALQTAELTDLAQKIPDVVTARAGIDGAFTSLADFVNRNPDSNAPEHRLRGALQAAIDFRNGENIPIDVNASGGTLRSVPNSLESLNEPFSSEDIPLSRFTVLADQVALELDSVVDQPVSQATPGYLTQADLLSRLGPVLSTRSDTFRVRAYGDYTNPVTAEVEAQAWCEVIVQRLPEYVVPESGGTTYAPDFPIDSTEANALGYGSQHADNEAFGRRFRIISFRWLNKEDV